jgi:hypothetical protein
MNPLFSGFFIACAFRCVSLQPALSVSNIVSNLLSANPHQRVTHMLTEVKLKALTARDALYRVADRDGLSIEIPTNGAARWRYRYSGHS